MPRLSPMILCAVALAASACAGAQAQSGTISTPEGALMQSGSDLVYKPGQLTEQQLASPTARRTPAARTRTSPTSPGTSP